MGPEQDCVAVADAGPLIHLGQIDARSLLGVFSQVHVPNAVWAETVGTGRVRLCDLEAAVVFRRHEIDPAGLRQFVQESDLRSLHPGETEALLLCRRLAVPLLLTDDLAARSCAAPRNPAGRLVGNRGPRLPQRPYSAGNRGGVHPSALPRQLPLRHANNCRSCDRAIAPPVGRQMVDEGTGHIRHPPPKLQHVGRGRMLRPPGPYPISASARRSRAGRPAPPPAAPVSPARAPRR